ncbi:MAG: tail fiber domain-containing protein [bacterium]|nr:tail fiber domain-containing protein [bacterium]
MKKIFSLCLFMCIAFSGCEAGLTSNRDSSSGDQENSGFSFSDLYSRMTSMETRNNEQDNTIALLEGSDLDTRFNNLETAVTGDEGLSSKVSSLEGSMSTWTDVYNGSILLSNTTGNAWGYGITIAANGGWARGFNFLDSSNKVVGGFCAGGVNDTLSALYIGDVNDPANPWVLFNPDGSISSKGIIHASGELLTSDKRYKKNITQIDSPLKKVLQLRGVYYNWRANEFKNKSFSKKRQIGFIAQEVEPVLPEVVATGKDGYKSLSYSTMTALLVEAIKEMKSQNNSTIAALKKENTALKQKLAHVDIIAKRVALLEQVNTCKR